jgi:hypothetical protein
MEGVPLVGGSVHLYCFPFPLRSCCPTCSTVRRDEAQYGHLIVQDRWWVPPKMGTNTELFQGNIRIQRRRGVNLLRNLVQGTFSGREE